MTTFTTAPAKSCELFYQGQTLEQIQRTTGHLDVTCVSTSITSYCRKMRERVLKSGLPTRIAVNQYADKVGMSHDAAWYCYWVVGTGMRFLLNPTSRYVPEIIRLSMKRDFYLDRQLPTMSIVRRLHDMHFDNATRESIEVIRSQLRSYGHPIKAHKSTKLYDPRAGTMTRMRVRIQRETFRDNGAPVLFWSRVLLRDVFVVKSVAAALSAELTSRYAADHVLTGTEFLSALESMIEAPTLRIAA